MESEEKIKGLIMGIGAIAELLKIYRDSLLANGFTREEAFILCQDLEQMVFETAGGNRNDED